MMMRARQIQLALVILLILPWTTGCGHRLSYISVQEPRARAAVLILPGLRNGHKGMRHMRRWYPQQGYDVHIPSYYSKDGMDQSVENLARYIDEHGLTEYDELYAMVYLMGGRVLNLYLDEHDLPNLTHIVYDRSPMQEQGPRMVVENMPRLANAMFGATIAEFAASDYSPIPRGDRRIGIIVECKATSYVRRHRDQLTPITPQSFRPEAFEQEHDDLIYVFRDHDEMYYSFDLIGPELLSFFRRGQFTEGAQRHPCVRDPFQ